MIHTVEPYSHGNRKLSDLGLDVASLTDVLLYGNAEQATYTNFDSRGAGGTAAWSRRARRLSEIYTPQGWQRIDPDGQPTLVHPDGKHCVITAAGNHFTGTSWGTPTTKNPRGKTFRDAVDNNLSLFAEDEVTPDLSDIRETWVLLSFRSGDGRIYAELSLPDNMVGNHISSWYTRILLPTIDPGTPDAFGSGNEDEPPNYDFAVTRK